MNISDKDDFQHADGSDALSPRIWVDATRVIRWGPQPPTGVHRVEGGLCEVALARDDVGLVALDFVLRRYDKLGPRALAYLHYVIQSQKSGLRLRRWQRLWQEFSYLDVQFRYGDTGVMRRWAEAWVNHNNPRSLTFKTVKAILRGGFVLHMIFRLIFGGTTDLLSRGLNWLIKKQKKKAIILISYEVNRSPVLSGALSRFNAVAAHITYDLIPILRPEFVTPRLSQKIKQQMANVLKHNEISVSISQTVADEYAAWNAEIVKAKYAYPFHVCKLSAAIDRDHGSIEPIIELAGKPFVVFVSTLDARKGQDFLLDVWAELIRRSPDSIVPQLVLIGRRGGVTPQLEATLASDLRLASKVHLLSNVGDAQLRWAYHNASFSLFPSKIEGWGLGVSEALAYGLPVIHSDIPILHEAAQNLMPSAPPRDVEAWCKLILAYLENPELLDQLKARIAADYVAGEPQDFARCVIAYLKLLQLQSATPVNE